MKRFLVILLIGITLLGGSVGCATAEFQVSSLTITPSQPVAGESVVAAVDIINIGGAEGVYTANLMLDGNLVDTRDVTVAAGATEKVSFTCYLEVAGEHSIVLGDLIATATVLEPVEFQISSLVITPTDVVAGEPVTVKADVTNTGGSEGVYTATLKVNGVVVETKDIPLAGGAKQEISFKITEDTPGFYRIALGELVGTLRVLRHAQFRVNPLSVTPNQIAPGETVRIKADLENTGEVEGTYHATLMVNGVEVETKDVPLAAGAKQEISFQLTEDIPGVYKVELGGLAVTFKVIRPAEFKVVSHTITPNPAKVGEEIEITIEVQNLGEAEGTYVASLILDGIAEETKETTLGGGVTESVSFSISRDSPGTYEIEIGGVKDVIRVIQPVRLPTGTYLVKKLSGGLGELTVENGLDLDAVVVLSSSEEFETPIAAVYVRSEASYTIRGIRDGTYAICFSLGEDWDNDSKKFIRKTQYQRFEDELHFETTGSMYTTFKVTLHPVIGGTAETEYLDEDEFPNLK